MLQVNDIKTIMFAILSVCFVFYLFIGIDTYKKDNKSKGNLIFFILCIITSLWAISYAFMIISPNIETANVWRIISSIGWSFFNAVWISFAFSFKDIKNKKASVIGQLLTYIASIIFFISDLLYKPSKVVNVKSYGFVDNLYVTTPIGNVFSIYIGVVFIAGLVIIINNVKKSQKNRVRKQLKIVLITCLISFILMAFTDLVCPILGIMDYPSGIIMITIGMYGMWYAINKHRLISISPKFVSEYIFKAVNEPIFILGEDFLVRNCNEALLNITGYKYKDLEKCPFNKIINFKNFNFSAIMNLGNAVNIEVELYRKNKEVLACELSSTVIYDEYKDLVGIVILLHDVSLRKNLAEIQKEYTLKLVESNRMLKKQIEERMSAEEKIRHFIYHDTLTEISNRKKMMEDINMLLQDKNEKFAIFFIDLDKFKSVNDNYGHKAGDFVLKDAAMRLKSVIRPIDTIGRIGGDEFIIILRQLKDETDIQNIAERVLKELNTAFIYNKNQLFIGGSIGISIFPSHGVSADMLISKADLAMYEVKNKGGDGYSIYNDIMNDNAINNLEVKKNIKDAINKNEFITYYQPIIDIKSMKILNAESLIRWKKDDKIILPVEFIPIAKEIGEIVDIDNWMLDNACYQCKKWQDLGAKYFGISVNTSYKQLIQFNFVKSVMNILNKYLLEPKYLNLEITEDEAMEDPDVIIKILLELKEQGIRISMDDFGTGYSSLSYINKLPVDIIKIDRSLIVNLANDSKNLVIIKAIIVMAHSLNIKVVAEGIETEKEFNALSKLECDFIQGYLIGKPLTASDFEDNFIDI